MHYAIANPYWHVPDHLVRRWLPSIVKQKDAYLKARNYEIISDFSENARVIPTSEVDWDAVASGRTKLLLRQRPGGANSMGRMKFPFPNGEDIYLHDTPMRAYFAKSQRTLSNGCVRVEDAKRLGRWLLGREPVTASEEAEQRIQLPQGVPIFLTYITAQPTTAGVTYLKDVYGWDNPTTSLASASAN